MPNKKACVHSSPGRRSQPVFVLNIFTNCRVASTKESMRKAICATSMVFGLFILSSCSHDWPRHELYEPKPPRDPAAVLWEAQLASESERPPQLSFGERGKVSAMAGAFPLDEDSAGGVARWLLARRQMFGLRADHSLVQAASGEVRAIDVAQSEIARRSSSADSGLRAVYVFDVHWQGFPHSGMQLVAVVVGKRPVLAGVLNTFVDSLEPGHLSKFLPEESAWAAAEAKFGVKLQRVEAAQVWFDSSWALQRVRGTQELHWRLLGLDPGGAPQFAFVRASDNNVSYFTPLVTGFSVPQTHKDSAGNVLWDSQTLPNGCVSGSTGCAGIALAESQRSRVIMPKVVDLWYTLTSPGGASPFVWPFTGLNRAPFDNQGGRRINVVVAKPPKVGLNIADVPTRDGSTGTYTFPEGTVTDGYTGHEYGHVLLAQLKSVHPGSIGGSTSSAASFTEAMADLVGMVTMHHGGVPPGPSAAHWRTDFSIGDFTYDVNGGVIATPPVAWDLVEGNCNGKGRARLGRAFLNAYGNNLQQFGDRPLTAGQATFRAWWIDIMRSFALLPDFSFPTIKDFYDATVSRAYLYPTPREFLPQMFLQSEMEKLGLDQAGCY
jgi:hypothetical protein